MTYKRSFHFLIVLIASFLVSSCKDTNDIDVSHIKAPIQIIRFDQALAKASSPQDVSKVLLSHPAFSDIYVHEALGIRSSGDSLLMEVSIFLKDSMTQDISNKVVDRYKDQKDLSKEIEGLYQHIQYYFPKFKKVPRIYTFISPFAYQMFVFDDTDGRESIAIGLDMFLFPEVDYKAIDPDNTNFSEYIIRSWTKEHITKKIADLQVQEILGEPKGFKLIDLMIQNGKSLYIISKLMPHEQDSIIHEYTAKQMQWCYDHELQIWSYFLNQKLFYESNPAKINKYVNPSPYSPNMPSEAPGRTANFIGYQIVKAYMERFPETTFEQLIQLSDGQLFLTKSKYKPKK